MKKKDIIQLVKKLVKEDAYGSATLTTQGMPNSSRAVAPQDEYPFTAKPKSRLPGIMEDESTSFKVVNADTGKTIDFGLDQAKAEDINAKIVKMKDADDVGKLSEFKQPKTFDPDTIRLVRDMLEDADIYHNDLVGGYDEPSSYLDKRTGGTIIKIPHYNGPDYTGAIFGKDVSDKIDRSKAAAKTVAAKLYYKYKAYIADKGDAYEISEKSPAGVYGNIYLWVMFNKDDKSGLNAKDYSAPKGGTQSTQFEEIDEIKVNYDFSEKELVRILKQLKRGASTEVDMIRAFEKSLGREITDKELFKEAPKGGTQSSQFEGIDEEEVHGKEIVITAGSLQNALTFIGKNLKKLSNSMLSRLLEILKLSSISDFPYNVKDLKPKLKQMTPEEAKTFGLELNKFHTDMKRKNIKQEAKTVIDPMAPLGGAATMSKQNIKMPTATHAIKLAKKTQEPVTIISPDVNEEEAPGTSMNNADIGILNDLVQLYRPEKLKATIDILAKGTTLTSKFPKKYEEMDINEMINDYIKERGDDNLMEHTRKYHKKAQLREERMEKATEKLFALFNQGKTDAEVRSIYLTKNIDMPDSFISKLRNSWESLRKTKLDLTLADKEAEGFQQIQQPKAIAGMEPGMEDGDVGMEEDKQLASGLFNETK